MGGYRKQLTIQPMYIFKELYSHVFLNNLNYGAQINQQKQTHHLRGGTLSLKSLDAMAFFQQLTRIIIWKHPNAIHVSFDTVLDINLFIGGDWAQKSFSCPM